jgi:hypothetical protein
VIDLDNLYGFPEPRATVHYCDPATIDHPLHRLVGMRQAGWWVLTLNGCIAAVLGPFATREVASERAEAWPRSGA